MMYSRICILLVPILPILFHIFFSYNGIYYLRRASLASSLTDKMSPCEGEDSGPWAMIKLFESWVIHKVTRKGETN